MHKRDYIIVGFVMILLIVSTLVPVFLGGAEDDSQSSSIAPYEEFYKPDDETERPIYGDTHMITFNYTYMMNYDVVPENLVMILNGTCTSYRSYWITVNRPDDEEIELLYTDRNETDYIDETISITRQNRIRENIYEKMRHILRRQEEDWSDPGLGGMADPTKVLFGEINEDVLVDPDPLKGEYEIIVKITGQDFEMKFGEKETKLAILSQQSVSEPRNLEGDYKDGKVELGWDKPDELGDGIRQYNIYRATTLSYYNYIGNVSGEKTEYVDDFEGETSYLNARKGDILYYRVVAINNDDHFYVVNSPAKRNLNPHYRRESTSLEKTIHLPYKDTEPSDMSYKWVMDYSSLTEDNFEERVNTDSVNINKMEGGDVFLYDINRAGEEYEKIVFEYEGGFFSKGEVDLFLEDDDATSDLNINMTESWCDFSGKIWAEEISGPGYEGLTIVKQTIQSEGAVSAGMDNTFDFIYKGNQTYWEVSKELDIEWEIDLTLDYEEDNGWIVSKENVTPMGFLGGPFRYNYSGSIDAEATFRQESNHLDEEKKMEGEVSKDISGTRHLIGGSSAQGMAETFSPLVGAGNIGYYLAIDQALDASMGNLELDWGPFRLAFSTNCQRDYFSMEKLYEYKYMDPMALPGIGSFLGTALKRVNLTNSQYLESRVEQQIQAESEELDYDCEEELKEWRKKRREELLQRGMLGNPWGIQQYNGIYRWDHYIYGGLVIEPLGYFGSEPLSEDELESYNEDREKFLENQLEEEDEDEGIIPGYTFVVLLVGILSGVLIYKKSKR